MVLPVVRREVITAVIFSVVPMFIAETTQIPTLAVNKVTVAHLDRLLIVALLPRAGGTREQRLGIVHAAAMASLHVRSFGHTRGRCRGALSLHACRNTNP